MKIKWRYLCLLGNLFLLLLSCSKEEKSNNNNLRENYFNELTSLQWQLVDMVKENKSIIRNCQIGDIYQFKNDCTIVINNANIDCNSNWWFLIEPKKWNIDEGLNLSIVTEEENAWIIRFSAKIKEINDDKLNLQVSDISDGRKVDFLFQALYN